MRTITEEIKIDVSEVKKERSRASIKEMMEQLGVFYKELTDFWSLFEHNQNDLTKNSIVFLDLHSLVLHTRNMDPAFLAYKTRKDNPYFISMIRNKRDEKYADLIDYLMVLLDNKMSVIRVKHDFQKGEDRKELSNELLRIISRNFNPDTLKKVSYNKVNKSFLVEFNDGVYGEVSLDDLGIADMESGLILDQPMISEQGNAVVLFTNEGETFDIDALVLKSLISDTVKTDIKKQSELTAECVGEKIKEARKTKAITQTQLSELTGIDQAILSKMETGKHIPRFDTIERIARGLEITVNQLLGASRVDG